LRRTEIRASPRLPFEPTTQPRHIAGGGFRSRMLMRLLTTARMVPPAKHLAKCTAPSSGSCSSGPSQEYPSFRAVCYCWPPCWFSSLSLLPGTFSRATAAPSRCACRVSFASHSRLLLPSSKMTRLGHERTIAPKVISLRQSGLAQPIEQDCKSRLVLDRKLADT
jgi:hypothetical protein